MIRYPTEALWQELAYLAYHLHWDFEQLPGRMTWPNLVLRRGLVQADALLDWVNKTSGDGFATNGNKLTRCTGAVVLMSSTNQRLRSYELQGAFPVRWSGPRLNVEEQ